MIDDLPDIGPLLGPNADLQEMTSEFSPTIAVAAQSALRIRKGFAIVRSGNILPVIDGKTCSSAFLGLPASHCGEMAKPRATLRDGVLLAGSTHSLNFLSHTFPALVFVKYITGPLRTVWLAQDLPPSLAALIGELLPLLAGGQQVERRQLEEGTYEIADCVFPMLPARPFLAALSARRMILPYILSRTPDRTPIKLFLRSGDHALVDDDQVAAWFVARGYLALSLSELPFAEQVALFTRASHIASFDSSTFTNLVFAVQAQTIVVLRKQKTPFDPMLALFVQDYDARIIFVDGEADTNDSCVPLKLLEQLDPSVL